MKHLYLPLGREGYQITADVARAGIETGEIRQCAQCSTAAMAVYH